MPDPHCSECHGTFVEKIEGEDDDPRQYQQHVPDDLEGGFPPGMDNFLMGLRHLLEQSVDRTSSTIRSAMQPQARQTGTTITMGSGNIGNTRVINIGGPNTLGRPPNTNNPSSGEVPTLSHFLRRVNQPPTPDVNERPNITGPLMAQYLLALLGGAPRAGGGLGGDPFADFLGGGGAEGGRGSGRWGDYVFNQEALDQIISQLMENGNTSRPVPAPEEMIEKLPREVLESGSPTLDKDCAVCKDQFKLENDDPNEAVVITLPCKHPFHEGCILPWIKSSGTCPVCRYALVPQPEHHEPGQGSPGAGATGPGNSSNNNSRSPGPQGLSGSGGILGALFGTMGNGSQSSSGTNRPTTTRSSDPSENPHIPGGWGDSVD